MDIKIRNEQKKDYRKVEEVTREAFWNLYFPGCDEHYLVHIMRKHKDFLPSLDFVATYKEKIIGNIMYAKSYVLDESGNRLETISFGPLSVMPEYQRHGIGSALVKHSIKEAMKQNYKAIIIYGAPYNYCKHGFKNGKDLNISNSDGKFPYGLLVLELEKDIFKGNKWKYYPSEVYNINEDDANAFNDTFPSKKKEYRYTQQIASIAFRAFLE